MSLVPPAVRAEWTKLRTVPSTAWAVLGTVGLTVGVALVGVLVADPRSCRPPGPECVVDTTATSLIGVYCGQVAAVALGVLAATNEYTTRMIHVSLAADPRRGAVFAARVAVVLAVVAGAGLLAVASSLAAGRIVLPGNGFTPANGYPALSLTQEPTLRAAGGTVLYFALVGLLGVGAGTAMRDTGGALTAVLSLLFVVPISAQFIPDEHFRELLLRYAPMSAGLSIQATQRLDALPIGPWAGIGVLAAYTAAALAAGYLVLRLRDA